MRLLAHSPLLVRLAAVIGPILALNLFLFAFSLPAFTCAAELDSIHNQDHNHRRLEHAALHTDSRNEEEADITYEPEFLVDRGIIGRADQAQDPTPTPSPPAPNPTPLLNNGPFKLNVEENQTVPYMVAKDVVQGKHGKYGPGLPSDVKGWAVQYNYQKGNKSDDSDGHNANELKKRYGDDDVDTSTDSATLEERQNGGGKTRTVYITANTCLQPQPVKQTTDTPPQLELYVSTSKKNKAPGPYVSDEFKSQQDMVKFDGGFASYTVDTSDDVYFSVYGPTLKGEPFEGVWNTEVAVSIDAPYHSYNADDPFLFLVDSDTNSALIITNNLTQAPGNSELYKQWMDLDPPPFKMFAMNQNDTLSRGMQHSYCGLSSQNTAYGIEMKSRMITRGLGNKPKEQFFITGLNSSSTYYGFLAIDSRGADDSSRVVGGGGQIWNAMNFTTKSGMETLFTHQFRADTLNRQQLPAYV
jgi:calcium channel MID1